MPKYQYRCDREECEHEFTIHQEFSEEPLAACPNCGEPTIKRVIGSPMVIFRGTGWTRKGKRILQPYDQGDGTGSAAVLDLSEHDAQPVPISRAEYDARVVQSARIATKDRTRFSAQGQHGALPGRPNQVG
jgi:putative FmdB family regulatory protein